jgi:hypothetical protein
MRFTIDPDALGGTSSDGLYSVRKRGDRYGTFLDIICDDKLTQTVWVRRNQRAVLPHEKPIAGDAEEVLEWVVDNNAGTGTDRLLTLTDPIGDTTLGELLQSFFEADEVLWAKRMDEQGRPWPRSLVRIGCRGNQRSMMEDRYGP